MMQPNKCLKWGALLFNFVVLIVGPTILAVSLRLLFDPEFSHVVFQDGNYYAGHILAAVGALMTVAGIFGCIGTVAENSCLLWMFFGSMLLFLVVEIAGGAYIYNQQDEFQENLQKTVYRAVEKDYGNKPEVNAKMDLIQSGWKCCGATSYKSWSRSDFGKPQMTVDFISTSGVYRIPKSCCIDQASTECEHISEGIRNDNANVTKLLYQEGCGKKLVDSIASYARYTFVSIAIVALIQLVAMTLTAVFAVSIRNSRGNASRFASRQGLNSSYASAPMLSNADSAESKRQFSASSPSVNASRSSLNLEPAMIMSKSSSLV